MEKILEKVNNELELAEEKLKAVKYLLNGKFYRDSTSRAYYAMFHAAKAVLLLKGLEPKTHRGVLSMFGLHLIKEANLDIYLGKALSYAEEVREDSDYSIGISVSKETAESIVNDANMFLEKIKKVIKFLSNK